MTAQPIATIQSYHAHIYFDGPEQRRIAETLREEIAQRFSVLIGRWHDRPIGPHTRPMYQVAFSTAEFARFVPWLMINRRGRRFVDEGEDGARFTYAKYGRAIFAEPGAKAYQIFDS